MLPSLGSLLAGRNTAPLSQGEIARAGNTFLGMDNTVSTRYDSEAATVFHTQFDEHGQEYGEIVFGRDIYPGQAIVDPNSVLSLDAAVAHELTHYYRWYDKSALEDPAVRYIDEALTSLQASLRYEKYLSESDRRQLVSDAFQRISLYIASLTVAQPAAPPPPQEAAG